MINMLKKYRFFTTDLITLFIIGLLTGTGIADPDPVISAISWILCVPLDIFAMTLMIPDMIKDIKRAEDDEEL